MGDPRPRRSPRRPARAAVTATLTGVLVAALVTVSSWTSATASTVRTVGPGTDLTAAFAALRAGDTLVLQPGVYDTGLVRPNVARGTSTAPITVRAADLTNRPLIRGAVKLHGASYWHLDGLRVQATVANTEALFMLGGTGWWVRHGEFWGARTTNAYANVSIGSDAVAGTGSPKQFDFTENCLHDAGRAVLGADHNLYLAFAGDSASGGLVARNIIWGHPSGAGIKVGNGGVAGARGPWGVRILYNTISEGGRQLLLHGDIRNTTIGRNLLDRSTQPFTQSPQTTAVYVHDVVGTNNVLSDTYASSASMVSWGSTITYGTGNGLRPDPAFTSRWSCSGYHPGYAKAVPYGRYGGGAVPTW